MSKKVIKEINKVIQLDNFADEEEFLDKFLSFLFVRYKFQEIKFLAIDDLITQSNLFSNNNLIVKNKSANYVLLSKEFVFDVEEIREIYVRLALRGGRDKFLILCVNKSFFKKLKEIEVFCSFLGQYVAKQLIIFSKEAEIIKLKSTPENIKVVEVVEKVERPQKEDITYFSLNTKLLPEQIDLEKMISKTEKDIIKEMLNKVNGVKTAAAKNLGITERMIGYKIQKYKIKY